ncbi:PREDICTED: SWI/SNF-related matrix-associated actin-dependent regulator of chromatin subfamily A-like protein 1 isoform X3 [Fragaria vesca subsp. vesca]|uniref:SWI/SNF-related matrix-associated actin-dependent regulator of chromatin subfamily A-like protein 1 isoform X3 n=1 Tax=Fragaria vesca subsp. vesca TaxID=101020 RepID=UPI0002C34998|nr:PREDICTED: SWI/SNF-related matrix-associated actin-dependent regulator of chromatin subfamily A-like protein 1 isoform X3 [Fragaria vesca subsp. vesca]
MDFDDDDDWNFSAEELDSLERDALQKLSQQRLNSASTCSSSFNCHHRPHQSLPTTASFISNQVPPPPRPPLSPGPRVLPSSLEAKVNPVERKLTVKFFLHATGNIAAKFSYDQAVVAAFRKIPKAAWHANERLWMFPVSSLSSAEKVLYEVSGVNVEIENLDPLVHRAIAAVSVVPDIRDRYDRIPSCIESKLLAFQREGVRFILQHGGRALLADEMGLGKTIQAIAVASCIHDSWPVLILTPSSLRLQWASMIQQWMNIPPSDILVVLSQCGGSNKAGYTLVSSSSKGTIHLDGLFNIISYDIVPKLQNQLMASDFKVVIADESHFLKNAQAKRTTASLPVIKKAKYAILLSGTPALSRPIELFKQLEALYPDVYKNVHEYGKRYCKGGTFGVYQGASNHEELHNLMKATVMIRRLKNDVLSELPVKRRQQVFLDLAEKDMKQINALFRELEVVKLKIKACKSKEEVDSLKFMEKNLINKIYTDSAVAKIPAVLDYLGTVIEAGCKFLVFAHHQSMIDAIYQFLLKKKVSCIRIDGSIPTVERQAYVTQFQEKDSVKAAVLSIKAGGVGLTLTAASTVLFAELSWTPGDLIQAEDRAHRIGQVSSVNVYYLLANDTVDDIIWDVVQSKLENLGQMLDGHENSLEVSDSLPRSSPAKQKTRSSPAKQKMRSSPAKQKTLDSFLKGSTTQAETSPGKQKTLDSFLKRCNNSEDHEIEPKTKNPRL